MNFNKDEQYADIIYTPYNLVIIINYIHYTKFNSLTLKLRTYDVEYLNVIKQSFFGSFTKDNGLYKLNKKLDWYFVSNHTIECLERDGILLMNVEVPIPRILRRPINTFYKVAKLIRKILLRKLPKKIEESYGLKKLFEVYKTLQAEITFTGSFNISKISKIFRNYTPYIGFQY